MSLFVETLKRLYKAGKITSEKIELLRVEDKITEEEYNYIFTQ